MAKETKKPAKATKAEVKVKDLKPKKDPKGGVKINPHGSVSIGREV